jgi:hypothetical protein
MSDDRAITVPSLSCLIAFSSISEEDVLMAEVQRVWLPRSADADAPVALSPARDRLRATIAALALAQRDLEDATAPVRRLDAVLAEVERLDYELGCSKGKDEAALGRWIAQGGVGDRPQPSATTVAADASLGELAPEVRAVAWALPAARAAQEAAAERVGLAAAERDAALHAVAVEAATFAARELVQALNRALTVEAKILSLREALSTQTNGLAAAEKINAALRQAKAAAGVPRNADVGRRLLDLLVHDSAAAL